MRKEVYLNGKFVPQEKAAVSVFDHGFLYGDGVFEGIRAYNGRIFKLQEHLVRLFESAHSILLHIPLTLAQMEAAVLETVRRNKLRDAYVRVVVSRGAGDLGLDPRKCSQSTVVIIADTITLFPEELYKKGLSVISVPTKRNIADALDPKIKSLNYLNNILVKIEASQAGVMEAIMMNNSGLITEGSGDNIFIVKKGRLLTPPPYVGVLEGITRAVVMELAQKEGIPVVETPFTRHDLYVADECFLTGTAAEVIPVIEVDGRSIGDRAPGMITKKLMESFRHLTDNNGTDVYSESFQS